MDIKYHDLGNGMAVCPRCGGVVYSKAIHTEFHEHLMKLKDFADQHQFRI